MTSYPISSHLISSHLISSSNTGTVRLLSLLSAHVQQRYYSHKNRRFSTISLLLYRFRSIQSFHSLLLLLLLLFVFCVPSSLIYIATACLSLFFLHHPWRIMSTCFGSCRVGMIDCEPSRRVARVIPFISNHFFSRAHCALFHTDSVYDRQTDELILHFPL